MSGRLDMYEKTRFEVKHFTTTNQKNNSGAPTSFGRHELEDCGPIFNISQPVGSGSGPTSTGLVSFYWNFRGTLSKHVAGQG